MKNLFTTSIIALSLLSMVACNHDNEPQPISPVQQLKVQHFETKSAEQPDSTIVNHNEEQKSLNKQLIDEVSPTDETTSNIQKVKLVKTNTSKAIIDEVTPTETTRLNIHKSKLVKSHADRTVVDEPEITDTNSFEVHEKTLSEWTRELRPSTHPTNDWMASEAPQVADVKTITLPDGTKAYVDPSFEGRQLKLMIVYYNNPDDMYDDGFEVLRNVDCSYSGTTLIFTLEGHRYQINDFRG
ncbi:hypothetical protein [Flammeovirga sp. SubArs3]|uniref:hypothetical protein n=1 Tax=Flammeovirga sp. SubArs3 TaxID=2995316 RepID=UPI00248B922A|nr:hypothetical protein [Flammeovirga sp. SubArs3]